jgi:hypothetical protein
LVNNVAYIIKSRIFSCSTSWIFQIFRSVAISEFSEKVLIWLKKPSTERTTTYRGHKINDRRQTDGFLFFGIQYEVTKPKFFFFYNFKSLFDNIWGALYWNLQLKLFHSKIFSIRASWIVKSNTPYNMPYKNKKIDVKSINKLEKVKSHPCFLVF